VAVSQSGIIYISDDNNDVIRIVGNNLCSNGNNKK